MKISLAVLYSGWTERRMNGSIETSEKVIKEKELKNYPIAYTMKWMLLSIVFMTVCNMFSIFISSFISHPTSSCKL